MKERIIDTGLTGKINDEIIRSVFGQLSDGMWENSPRMEGYWRCGSSEFKNDKIYLKIDTREWWKDYHGYKENPYVKMSDTEIKNWFAQKIKILVKDECGEWDRNSDTELVYISYKENVTVADAYYAYEVLKGRNVTKHKEYNKIELRNKENAEFEDRLNTIGADEDWNESVKILSRNGYVLTENFDEEDEDEEENLCPKCGVAMRSMITDDPYIDNQLVDGFECPECGYDSIYDDLDECSKKKSKKSKKIVKESAMTIEDVVNEVNRYTRYDMELNGDQYTLYSKETGEEIETSNWEEQDGFIWLAGAPYEKWITALDD